MNKYETVFILTPVLSDVQMKEAVEKFAKVVTDNGGKIVSAGVCASLPIPSRKSQQDFMPSLNLRQKHRL